MTRLLSVCLTVILIFCVKTALSQSWPPVGAQWHFTQHYNMSSAVSYNKIEVEKDTIVQGKNCKKLNS